MTAHKHVDIITAKANNMELVVFCELKKDKTWIEVDIDGLPRFNEKTEYFLCLPQHKEAVLNILNGGTSQITSNSHWNNPFTINHLCDWLDSSKIWYMSQHCQSRIKPKKEKRWIVLSPPGVDGALYLSEDDAKKRAHALYRHDQWQIIEIEVEV